MAFLLGLIIWVGLGMLIFYGAYTLSKALMTAIIKPKKIEPIVPLMPRWKLQAMEQDLLPPRTPQNWIREAEAKIIYPPTPKIAKLTARTITADKIWASSYPMSGEGPKRIYDNAGRIVGYERPVKPYTYRKYDNHEGDSEDEVTFHDGYGEALFRRGRQAP